MLQTDDFFQAALVAFFAGEARIEENGAEVFCQFRTDDARTQNQDIHIVMFHALMGGIGVVGQAGADSRDFVGSHGCSHAAAADENAALGFAAKNATSAA